MDRQLWISFTVIIILGFSNSLRAFIWYYLVQNVEAAATDESTLPINVNFRYFTFFSRNLALELWGVFKQNRTSLFFGLYVIGTFFCNELEGHLSIDVNLFLEFFFTSQGIIFHLQIAVCTIRSPNNLSSTLILSSCLSMTLFERKNISG